MLCRLWSLGIHFVFYDNNLDTTTPTGKLVFQIIGAVAELEKDIIRERVRAGLENARQKGKRLGRPTVNNDIIEKAIVLRKQGLSFRKIEKNWVLVKVRLERGLKNLKIKIAKKKILMFLLYKS